MDTRAEKIKNVVLGAGIAGLAYASQVKDEECVIFEKENHYGGLCHSFHVEGFNFDTAVHLSFTKIQEVRDYFDRTSYIKHNPISYNYYHSYWLKHPAIFNLAPLSTQEKVLFIESYINSKYTGRITNYKEWLVASYGKAIAEKLYEVYTKKYWTVPAEALSTNWIGDRMNQSDLGKVLSGAFEVDDRNDYYATEMRYPEKGGYQSFLKDMADEATIQFNKEVVKVETNNKKVIFSDGTSVYYENLISSIPIPELIKCMEAVPSEIIQLSSELKATKISIVSIGFNKPEIAKLLWFYIYDQDILAARVNSPSIKSPENAPFGCSSLQFEIYHNHEETIDENLILANVKDSLLKMKLCKEEDILFMDYRLIPYGNVIFLKGMENKRDKIVEFLNDSKVTLIGRFGEWGYLWSDQSYMSGINAARKHIVK